MLIGQWDLQVEFRVEVRTGDINLQVVSILMILKTVLGIRNRALVAWD